MKKPLIMVVDDEIDNLNVLESRLKRRGYATLCVSSGKEALDILKKSMPDLVLLDVMMPEMDGMETCKRMKEITSNVFLPVIFLTAKDEKESRIKGFDIGADDYITKPFDIDELNARIRSMLRIKDLKNELNIKEREIKRLSGKLLEKQALVGNSIAMHDVIKKMHWASSVTSPVIITGESGTGKEMVAKGIHYDSPLAGEPFIAVNCAALPSELIESELFGHRKGAFTGAQAAYEGLFKAADGGTIFLDEITEMSRDVQAKLLRVLQENRVRMVGGTEEIPINVRLIAATNVNVEEAVRDGNLREDLYYRISVLSIPLPPLREKKEDIPLLAQHMMTGFNERFGRSIKSITPAALKALSAHGWPGNVRELQNVIERCYAIPDIELIDVEHIQIGHQPPGKEVRDDKIPSMEEAEKQLILKALEKTGHNKLKTAKLLGIHRSRLYKKLERHGISSQQS